MRARNKKKSNSKLEHIKSLIKYINNKKIFLILSIIYISFILFGYALGGWVGAIVYTMVISYILGVGWLYVSAILKSKDDSIKISQKQNLNLFGEYRNDINLMNHHNFISQKELEKIYRKSQSTDIVSFLVLSIMFIFFVILLPPEAIVCICLIIFSGLIIDIYNKILRKITGKNRKRRKVMFIKINNNFKHYHKAKKYIFFY